REIADRLRAGPGSSAYGSPSVVVQLSCQVELIRNVNRAVFRPRPRVDSALVGLRRVGPAPGPEVVGLVRAAFAHRRKPLASSLDLARMASRADARGALERLGLPPDSRAERLAPGQFATLAAELGVA
ncbi:MAG TPA: rRNA adenine N-6-methyltransferase family protein, partial [Solirubrobacterales bacterium]|nr:rRNA adenine N-6-methyltransferase family protein [Solirubrobacterales bacterium]